MKKLHPELVKNILEEAAKINQNIILPLAKSGDENPSNFRKWSCNNSTRI